jgi:hypothetical protein
MSRIFVDRISPYQSGSVQVDGLNIDTGSLATTGSNTFQGNQVVNGNDKQIISAPNSNEQIDTVSVTGVTIGGTPYPYANLTFQNFGGAFENVFAIEQADSVNFNYYGTMFTNGKGWSYNLSPSGSGGTVSSIRLREIGGAQTQIDLFASKTNITSINDDLLLRATNANIEIKADNGSIIVTGSVDVSGSVQVSQVLQLTGLDPLPGGGTGQLAVSGSNLYYHDGSDWAQIN